MPGPRRPIATVVALLVALVSCSGAANAETTFDDPALRTRQTELPNGLRILTLEDHTTPVVSFQMWVRAGSRDESRVTGLAHLFEHMMFKGSKNIPPEEHARIIQSRGGRSNAYTTRDTTVYLEDVTSETLPLVIDLAAERLANLDINERTLTSEREVVLEERRLRSEDSPTGRALEALFALTFQAHPYRWPVIGWRSDVESTTVEVCREFFDAFYVPNNIVIAVVGSFDTESALARISDAFGELEARESIPRNPTLEPEQEGERTAVVHFDLRSPLLAAAWHAPPSGHADAEALDVVSQILSGGRSSRLYRSLVYDAQQVLAAQGGYWELADAGVFYAYARVRPEASIDAVEGLFFAEIDRLREEPVTSTELEKAKRQIEVAMVHGMTTHKALASRIAYDVAVLGRIRPLRERLDAIRAVTVEDVQRVARAYLVDEHRNVVRVVPPPAAAPGEGP
jgi:predicted Zn-dependent peptidase